MEMRWLVSLVTFVGVAVCGITSAFACTAPMDCSRTVERGELPSCLVLSERTSSCEPDLDVQNQCDRAVEFVELECDDGCSEPVVVESGQAATLDFVDAPLGDDRSIDYRVGWSAADSEGVLEVVVDDDDRLETFHGCSSGSDADSACTVSGWRTPRAGLFAVIFVFLLFGWRRKGRE